MIGAVAHRRKNARTAPFHLISRFATASLQGEAISVPRFTTYIKINIPPHSGGYFIFGHSPNITGCAQVRFSLACQPCICYLPPVNGFPFCRSPLSNTFSVSYSLPCVKGGGTAPAVTEGLWLHCFSSILLSSQSPTALRAEPPLHKGAFSLRRVFSPLKLF